MKGTILSGVLAASLLLTGCASMLTREYGSVAVSYTHLTLPTTERV